MELIGVHVDREQAFEPGRSSHRFQSITAGCEPERGARSLNGPGFEQHTVDGVVAAHIHHHFARQEIGEDVGTLVEHYPTRRSVGDFIETREFPTRVDAETESERDPAFTEQVDGENLACKLHRPASDNGGDEGTEPDPIGDGGDCGKGDPGVEDLVALGAKNVIPEEQAVPARLLHRDSELDHPMRVGEGAERCDEDAVLHDSTIGDRESHRAGNVTPMIELHRVCVFCASSPGTDPATTDATVALGELLAQREIELIFGGGAVGLMGLIADTVMGSGGRVTGVIPKNLFTREVGHRGLTRLEEVASMHERKARMYDLSDAFIALPGGLGTLEELAETLTWSQIGLHAKPTGVLNVNGFWDPLLELLDTMVDRTVLKPSNRALLLCHDEPAGLLEALASHEPIREPKWMGDDAI